MTSNLCKNCLAALLERTATYPVASRLDPIRATMTVMRSRGSVALLPAMWLLGSSAAATVATTMDLATMAVRLPGPLKVVAATAVTVAMAAITAMARRVATVPLELHPHGNKRRPPLLRPRVDRHRMATEAIPLTLAWERPVLLLA